MPKEILRTAVAPNGDVYSLQTGGHIVRHGNPKKKDARAEVVYEARERLDGLWISPSGAVHAAGKHYHTNAGGKWRKERVPTKDLDVLIAVWAPNDDEPWVGSGKGEVLSRKSGTWRVVPTGLPGDGNMIYAINGTKSGAVYVTSDEGVAYFDGRKWHKAKMPGDCYFLDVLPREKNALVVGRDGPNLFQGSGVAWKAIKGLTDDPSEDFYAVAERGKDVYIATGARLLVWDGKKARDAIPRAEGKQYLNCMHVGSNGDVIAATGRDGVHVLVGTEWKLWPATATATPAAKAKATAGKTNGAAKVSATKKTAVKKIAAKKTAAGAGRRYELSGGGSHKFWEVSLAGAVLSVRFGRIGTDGQVKKKSFASAAAAEKERDKLIAEKTKKGYRAVS